MSEFDPLLSAELAALAGAVERYAPAIALSTGIGGTYAVYVFSFDEAGCALESRLYDTQGNQGAFRVRKDGEPEVFDLAQRFWESYGGVNGTTLAIVTPCSLNGTTGRWEAILSHPGDNLSLEEDLRDGEWCNPEILTLVQMLEEG